MLLISLFACILDWDGDDTGSDPGDLSSFVDHSVNAASAGGSPLVLRTEAGSAEVGGFNGSGQGNKAIAGVPGLDGRALAGWSGLMMESTVVEGATSPYFNVVLDLDCTGARLSLLVADPTVATVEASDDGAERYSYATDAAQWKAVGGLDSLLPAHLEEYGGALTDVLAAYPDACLRDAATGDGGMPNGEVTSAVMVILGDSNNVVAAEHHVRRVDVGGLSFE